MHAPGSNRRLRFSLIADSVVELLLAILFMAIPSAVGRWLAIAPPVATAIGAVFLVAAVGVGLIAYRSANRRQIVRALAFGNIVGGAIGWALLIIAWSSFAAPGRAILGTASDLFIAVGALELIYLRKIASQPAA